MELREDKGYSTPWGVQTRRGKGTLDGTMRDRRLRVPTATTIPWPVRQFQKGPIQAAVTSVSAKRSYRALALDFENARKTLWVKQQLCAAELTTKGSLYEV